MLANVFFRFYYHFTLNIKCNKVIEGEEKGERETKTLIYFEVHDEISSREFVNYVICLMCQYHWNDCWNVF